MLWVVDVIKVKEKAEILQRSTFFHQSPQLQPGSIPEVVLLRSFLFYSSNQLAPYCLAVLVQNTESIVDCPRCKVVFVKLRKKGDFKGLHLA